MSTTESPENTPDTLSREERLAALFASMIIQQTNMAMMFLGKVPHPETGQTVQDFETAQMFIDQLEMLEAKTKGNLSKHEEALLKQSLTSLRMGFVDAVNARRASGEPPGATPPPTATAAPAAASASESREPTDAASTAPADSESRKKFTKKY